MADQHAETVLAQRLREAAEKLDALAVAASDGGMNFADAQRLRGKAEGVRLALSYLEERKRELRHIDGDQRG